MAVALGNRHFEMIFPQTTPEPFLIVVIASTQPNCPAATGDNQG